MIVDLALAEGSSRENHTVCIVGAGTVGLLVAAKLRSRGLRVVVLESGSTTQSDHTQSLNNVVQINTPYHGATDGRVRALGGTSTIWGGALIPFLPDDLLARPHLGVAAWPIQYSEVESYLDEIYALFGIESGSFENDFLLAIGAVSDVPAGDPDFLARFAKWPLFRRRNIYNLLRNQISKDPELRVWVNATVKDFSLNRETGRLESVVASNQNGKTIEVFADQFVICAGAIESTRLMLWLDRLSDGFISSRCTALGRYFFDHVSTVSADIEARDTDLLNRLAGFRFGKETMRSLRYELSPAAQRQDSVASAFSHIKFYTLLPTGYDALQELLRGLQKNGKFRPAVALEVIKNAPYLANVVAWRLFRKQLYWPKPARYELHCVAEQLPHAENRITLSNQTDVFGVPLAAIDWRVRQMEHDTIAAYARRFSRFWTTHLDKVGCLKWRTNYEAPVLDLLQTSDIFHPGGSTRMGNDSATSVVDENLQVFGISNLSVLSSSVFPSGASANPTLMLMLFALRLASHLGRKIKSVG